VAIGPSKLTVRWRQVN